MLDLVAGVLLMIVLLVLVAALVGAAFVWAEWYDDRHPIRRDTRDDV